jgi:hypothetical protein
MQVELGPLRRALETELRVLDKRIATRKQRARLH